MKCGGAFRFVCCWSCLAAAAVGGGGGCGGGGGGGSGGGGGGERGTIVRIWVPHLMCLCVDIVIRPDHYIDFFSRQCVSKQNSSFSPLGTRRGRVGSWKRFFFFFVEEREVPVLSFTKVSLVNRLFRLSK